MLLQFDMPWNEAHTHTQYDWNADLLRLLLFSQQSFIHISKEHLPILFNSSRRSRSGGVVIQMRWKSLCVMSMFVGFDENSLRYIYMCTCFKDILNVREKQNNPQIFAIYEDFVFLAAFFRQGFFFLKSNCWVIFYHLMIAK